MSDEKNKHIFETDISDEIIYFQIESIKVNSGCDFLPVVTYKNVDKTVFEYDVSGMCPLEEISENYFKSKNNLVDFLISFANCIKWCEKYFLDPYNVQGHLGSIYLSGEIKCNPNLADVFRYIYTPIISNEGSDPVKSIVEELFSLKDTCLSKEEAFSLEFEFLESWDLNTLDCGLEELEKFRSCPGTSSAGNDSGKQMKDLFMPVGIVLLEILLVALSFMTLKNRHLFSSGFAPAALAGLFIIICIALDILFVFSRNSPIKPDLSLIKKYLKEVFSFLNTGETTVSEESFAHNPKTGVLSETMPGSGLQEQGKKIYIISDDFIIGTDPAKTDYSIDCENADAVHARITKKHNVFFIEDEGSKNGTYLNGERLKKQREYMLKEKALIRFATKELYFYSD